MGVRAEFSSGGAGDLRGAPAAKDPGRQGFPGLSFFLFSDGILGGWKHRPGSFRGEGAGCFCVSVNLKFFHPDI
jgi:hypothetical protein